MKLKLIRETKTNAETIGSLYIDGKFYCYTLEDTYREKKQFANTCIPYGTYSVQVTMSTRFKRKLPLIYNQKDLSVLDKDGDRWLGIRIHGGNSHMDTEGCILVAKTRHLNEKSGFLDSAKKTILNWIQGSMADQITKLLDNGQVHTLEIV